MFKDREFGPPKAFLTPVDEPDSIGVLRTAGHVSNNASTCAGRSQDLGSFWNDDMKLTIAMQLFLISEFTISAARALGRFSASGTRYPEQRFYRKGAARSGMSSTAAPIEMSRTTSNTPGIGSPLVTRLQANAVMVDTS